MENNKKLKVLVAFGTRPEAIKMAPLVLNLRENPCISARVCVTGQHREMLDSVLSIFNLVPDYDLKIMKEGQTLSDITNRVLEGMTEIFEDFAPDVVLVHGDTTTAFSVALAAFYRQIPVGHVEAGLRSHQKYSPFPEEMNRCLIANLSEYHFAPTTINAENLVSEGIRNNVFITGNTIIDAIQYTVKDAQFREKTLQKLDFSNKKVVVLTCHRRENFGKPMENIFEAIQHLSSNFKDVEFVYTVHPNPIVKNLAFQLLNNLPNVHLIEPLDVVEMHHLLSSSYMVITDSGGLQEEAVAFKKPVLVLRENTERVEAIKSGNALLVGTDPNVIYSEASRLLTDKESYDTMTLAPNPYGDGQACSRITEVLLDSFGYNKSGSEIGEH